MKKRRIVLASILKPIDDTRMFEKLGTSLSTIKDYEVFNGDSDGLYVGLIDTRTGVVSRGFIMRTYSEKSKDEANIHDYIEIKKINLH